MLTDGLQLLGDSTAVNFAVDSGAVLPSDTTSGELFYLTGTGLHVHDGAAWVLVGAGATVDSAAIVAGLGYTPAALENGKIVISQIPAIAVTDTFVVDTQAGMLALTAEVGDVAVRTDTNTTYILKTGDPTVLANWVRLLTPTSDVTSVNAQTGNVVLTTTNIAEGTNQYFTNARARSSISVSGTGGSYNSSTGVITISPASSSNFTLANGAGGNTQIQYNDNGVLTGSSKFTWVDTTGTLLVGPVSAGGGATIAQPSGSGGSGTFSILAANAGAHNTTGGSLSLQAGGAFAGSTGNWGGNVTITGGAGTNTGALAGDVIISGGGGGNPASGNVQIKSGSGGGGVGYVTISSGATERLRITSTGAWGLSGAANVGTAGQVLTSQGNAAPIWTTVASATGDFKADGTVAMTGQLKTYAGSNAVPAIRIGANNNTGINGINDFVEIVSAGSVRFQVNTTVVTAVNPFQALSGMTSASGSTATPGYGISGDTDTGMFGGGSNILGFSTAGVQRFTITAAGGFSVGASSTAYGTSGQVLTSNGDAPPVWAVPTAGAAAAGTLTGTTLAANVINSSLRTIITPAGQALNIKSENDNVGAIVLGGSANPGSSIIGFDGSANAGPMTIRPNNGSFTGYAGDLNLSAGSTTATNGGAGGSVRINAGTAGNGNNGSIILTAGPSPATAGLILMKTSGLYITNSDSWSTTAAQSLWFGDGSGLAAAPATIYGGTLNESGTGPSGDFTIRGVRSTKTGVAAGALVLMGGNGAYSDGGMVKIMGGMGGNPGNPGVHSPITFSTSNVERLRITAAGGFSVGSAGTAVGTSGQVLTSQGDAPPTWTTIAAASGTVSSVSVTTANGVSGTVATATTTPAITLTLGNIVPTYVTTPGANISAAANTYRSLFFSTSEVANGGRWIMGADNATEGGTSDGSNFFLTRQASNGTQSIALTISRATGVFDFKTTPTVNGTVIGSTAAAGSLTGTTLATNVIQASLSTIYSPSTTFKTTAEAAGTIILGGNSGPGGTIRGFDLGTGPGTVTVRPGDISFSSTTGGSLNLTGGANTSTGAGAHGGPVNITGGAGSGGNGGNVTLAGAAGSSAGNGGNATVIGGTATGANVGGNVSFGGGQAASLANAGAIRFVTGTTASYLERFRVTGAGGLAFGNNATNVGTAGQVLTSAGDAPPTWSAAPAAAAGTLTGATMAANVITSSLTTIGTLGSLTVAGVTQFQGNTSISRAAGGNAYFETAANGNTAGTNSMLYGQDTANTGYVWNRASAAIVFATNSVERGRFSTAGNFLIGTQTDDNTNKLQVAGDASIYTKLGIATNAHVQASALQLGRVFSFAHDLNSGYMGAGWFGTASGAATYAITGNTAVRQHMDSALGNITWLNAVAGTAGTAVPFTERMRLAPTGNLLIGTTEDDGSAKLQVNGSLKAAAIALPYANTGIEMGSPGTASTPFIDFRSSGNAGNDWDARLIANGGTSATGAGTLTCNAASFVVTGALTAASISESSTIRIKENVRQLEGGLESVLALRGVVYDMKDGSATDQIGLIAEEVNEVLPALVARDTGGEISGVHYARMVAVLIEGMKAQEQRIKSLEAMVQELKNG